MKHFNCYLESSKNQHRQPWRGLKIFQSVKILGLEIPDHPNKKNNIVVLRPFSGRALSWG